MAEIESASFEYEAGGQKFLGAFVTGAGVEPSAACVLLPDWRGQSPLAHDHARFLIEQGCAVVIGDLYGDGFSPIEPSQVGEMVKRLIEHREQGVAALVACFSALRARVGAGLPIFCLGYSAGGMVALDYGRSGADLNGIIVASALLKTAAPGMPTRIKAPVLILQGTQDQVSPVDVIASVIAEMDAARERLSPRAVRAIASCVRQSRSGDGSDCAPRLLGRGGGAVAQGDRGIHSRENANGGYCALTN